MNHHLIGNLNLWHHFTSWLLTSLLCHTLAESLLRCRGMESGRRGEGERDRGTITSIAGAEQGPAGNGQSLRSREGGGDCQLLPAPARHPHTPPRERRLSWDTGVISPPMLRLRLIIQEGASVIIMSSEGVTCPQWRGCHHHSWDHGTNNDKTLHRLMNECRIQIYVYFPLPQVLSK